MYNQRIQIFSQTGDYLNHFGYPHLDSPWGILINQDNLYVTDVTHNAIFKFGLPDLTLMKKVGKRGSGRQEFYHPRQLAISSNKHLYIPDLSNDRVQIMTTNLEFRGSLRHKSLHKPSDVKFSHDQIFVLSISDNPCIHVFTLSGEKSSLVTRGGDGMQVNITSFFCLDGHNNIIISDAMAGNIKVFSQEGKLLHTIGELEHKTRMLLPIMGIIAHNNMLICVTQNKRFGLIIFSA